MAHKLSKDTVLVLTESDVPMNAKPIVVDTGQVPSTSDVCTLPLSSRPGDEFPHRFCQFRG